MSKQIEGTKATIESLATTLDAESRVPYASEPCPCGVKALSPYRYPVDVVDRYAAIVRCSACGKVTRAAERGATIQVRAVKVAKDGTASYPCDAALEARIADAKAKPAKDRTSIEAALAACSAPAEKPVDDAPKKEIKS